MFNLVLVIGLILILALDYVLAPVLYQLDMQNMTNDSSVEPQLILFCAAACASAGTK